MPHAWNRIDADLIPENIKDWVNIFWVDGTYTGGSSGWTRPAEWLPLSTLAPNDEKIEILTFVTDTDANFVAFVCAGDYTVDWGDGVTENVASGVKAEHTYTYSDTDLNSDTVAKYGYKQCIITITPNGWNLTSANFNQYHSSIGSWVTNAANGFLDMIIAGQNIATLVIWGTTRYVTNSFLEQCIIVSMGVVTNLSYMFYDCRSLQSVSISGTSSVTDTSYMFYNCYDLVTIPIFDTSSVLSMNNMFYNCRSLQTVPLFDTSSVTTMVEMFRSCYDLVTIPLFITSSVTTMVNMFSYCHSLQTVPLFDTGIVTDMNNMFYSCSKIQSIPLFNTSLVTNMSYMCSACFLLKTVPLFDTSKVTNMSYMFQSSYNLQTVPLFDTSKVTTMLWMFSGCNSLMIVPAFNTSLVTTMTNIFASCSSLTKIECAIKYSVNISNQRHSSASLDAIYTNLPTKTGQTLTVTGNYWTSWDTPSIATAKWWTVTW